MVLIGQQERSLELVEHLELGIILLNQNMRVVRWNRWVEKRTGILSSEAVGKNFFEVIPHAKDIAGVYEAICDALRQGCPAAPPLAVQGPLLPTYGRSVQTIRLLPVLKGGHRSCLLQISDRDRGQISPSSEWDERFEDWPRSCRTRRIIEPKRSRSSPPRFIPAVLDIETALQQNDFRMAFQPIVGPDGSVKGCEGLLRWRHKATDVSPSDFIPLAERSGLIGAVGRTGLRLGLDALRRWHKDEGFEGFLSANVSALQFEEPGFECWLAYELESYSVSPEHVLIELTESAEVGDMDVMAARMRRLKDKGFLVALDDFGTGFASLGQLARLPVDILKLDGSFVKDIETNTRVRELFEGVVELAQKLGFHLIIEGIETNAHLEVIRQAGEFFGLQGFHLCRPVEEHALLRAVMREGSLAMHQNQTELWW